MVVYPIMNTRRKQRQSRTHAPAWVLLFLVAAIAFVGVATLRGVMNVTDEWTEDLPSVVESDAFNYSEKSTVYAADGETVLAEFRLENREPLSRLSSVSQYLINATIDTEDNRFYEHNGVDFYGIARAVINNLMGGSLEGASTITQQLVRNTILSDEMNNISLERKIREANLALEMEKYYSKDEILLMYLNTINYGDGAYGIEAAALHYFSKHASDLNLAEAAMLAGIPQSPSNWNPVYNPEGCKERRNKVLSRMMAAGHITQEEYTSAASSDLNLNLEPKDESNGIYLYPYFTSYVRTWLLNEYSMNDIFAGGLKIYSTLDVSMQDIAEQACADQNSSMADGLESAMVAVDPSNGHVVAMVGGADYSQNQFNVAAQGGRPTGSSFKTFTLIAAIEAGIDPSTSVDCSSPYRLKSGLGTVENFGGMQYGTRSLQSATAVSSNTAYVQLQEFLGGDKVIEVCKRLGIDTSDLLNVDTLTLGVFDITPLEMASAYATLAANGIHYDPVVVTKIVDRKGNEIYKDTQEGKRVLDESTCGAVTDVLKTVFTQGDGTAAGSRLAGGRPVAGKTGTTSDFHDHTLIGYTPDLVCACWIGDRFAQITSENLSCGTMFKQFMDGALASTPANDFPSYERPHYTNPWKPDVKRAEDAEDQTGKTQEDAVAALDDFNVTIEEEYSDTVPVGVVISQTATGDKGITLIISKGPDPNKKDPADPTKPTDPTNPTDPTKPTDPTNPGGDTGGGGDAGGGSSSSSS